MKTSLCSLLLLIASGSAVADSPVWKVTKGDNHVYVAGTMHLLKQSDYPLPEQFEKAYDQADIAVFEADETQMSDPATQMMLMQKVMYTDGTTLSDKLSPETMTELEKYLASKALPKQQLMVMKPSMLSVTLTVLASQGIGYTQPGVDAHFGAKSREQNKPTEYFETAQQQIEFISQMGEGNEDAFMRYTLEDLNDIENSMTTLSNAWRQGNFDAMEKDMLTEMRRDFPGFYAILIKDRNDRWMPQIETYLDSAPVEVIMVGALHLAGPDGLLAQLESRGYKLEEVH